MEVTYLTLPTRLGRERRPQTQSPNGHGCPTHPLCTWYVECESHIEKSPIQITRRARSACSPTGIHCVAVEGALGGYEGIVVVVSPEGGRGGKCMHQSTVYMVVLTSIKLAALLGSLVLQDYSPVLI